MTKHIGMDVFNNKEEGIFNLSVDETTRSYMLETARWGKFLAIISFICMGLLILVGLFFAFSSSAGQSSILALGTGIGVMIVYVILAAIYFYPVWALFRFSVLSKKALNTYNQHLFNESLRYLRNIFKFLGIVTIITLALYGIVFIFVMIGAMASGL